MRVLEKTVTLGEMKFKVGANRDIAVKAFEEFPELIEYLFNKQKESNLSEDAFLLSAIKKKELSKLFSMEKEIAELIKFALPLMLKAANDDTKATDIIKYAEDNGASTVMNSGLLEFLIQGFTQGELVKPKVKFSMK